MFAAFVRILLGLALGGSALAQDRPDRDARGLRVGSFMIHPSIALQTGADTNFFLGSLNPQSTFFGAVAPRVEIRSDWNRHALKLEADARAVFFTHDSNDNTIDYNFTLAGQADITHKARLTGEISFARDHDQRGSNDVPAAADRPVGFFDMNAKLSGEVLLGRARIAPFAEWRQLNFDDTGLLGGGVNNQDDRDRTELRMALAVGVKVTRGYEGFLSAAYIQTDYDAAVDDTGIDRDSTGYQVLGGFRVRLSRAFQASSD